MNELRLFEAYNLVNIDTLNAPDRRVKAYSRRKTTISTSKLTVIPEFLLVMFHS